LLLRNGVPVGHEPEGLQRINDWFLENVRADKTGAWPALEWRSIAMDIGLYLGHAVISERPNLHWDLVTSGPTFIDYREHVIVGFGNAFRGYRVSPSSVIFTYATRAVFKDSSEIVIVDGTPMEFDIRPLDKQFLPNLFAALLEKA
jgi:hypothetical protein